MSGPTTPPKSAQAEPTFPDQETSVWTFDEQAGQYYLHRFYKHQPDLNVANPLVRDEIAKIMGFWLQLGLSGFRVDAVPFFLETMGVPGGEEALPDPHEYLRDLRALLNRRTGDAILLGEVNLAHKHQLEFFGGPEGDELHMQFDFIGMQRLYLSLARADCGPLVDALLTRPQPQPESQWASFVRNHDELTLDKLSETERQEVFAAFGPEPEMQIYGRGLIRRLPPMLGGDQRRIRMVYSLLFSLPGTPVLFYGEEIGMGENLEAGEPTGGAYADAVVIREERGVLQCRPQPALRPAAAGRVRAGVRQCHRPAARPRLPAQLHPPARLDLPRLPRARLGHPGGAGAALRGRAGPSLHLGRRLDRDAAQCGAGPGGGAARPCTELEPGTVLADLLEHGEVVPDPKGRVELTLAAYGYRWLRITPPGSRRLR